MELTNRLSVRERREKREQEAKRNKELRDQVPSTV